MDGLCQWSGETALNLNQGGASPGQKPYLFIENNAEEGSGSVIELRQVIARPLCLCGANNVAPSSGWGKMALVRISDITNGRDVSVTKMNSSAPSLPSQVKCRIFSSITRTSVIRQRFSPASSFFATTPTPDILFVASCLGGKETIDTVSMGSWRGAAALTQPIVLREGEGLAYSPFDTTPVNSETFAIMRITFAIGANLYTSLFSTAAVPDMSMASWALMNQSGSGVVIEVLEVEHFPWQAPDAINNPSTGSLRSWSLSKYTKTANYKGEAQTATWASALGEVVTPVPFNTSQPVPSYVKMTIPSFDFPLAPEGATFPGNNKGYLGGLHTPWRFKSYLTAQPYNSVLSGMGHYTPWTDVLYKANGNRDGFKIRPGEGLLITNFSIASMTFGGSSNLFHIPAHSPSWLDVQVSYYTEDTGGGPVQTVSFGGAM